MIKPICDICKKELTEYGALVFSPPDKSNKVTKNHVCKKCYNKIKKEYKL